MKGKRWCLLLASILMMVMPYAAYGKKTSVRTLDELQRSSQVSGITIIIKKHIDLNHATINLVAGNELTFKGGSLSNGVVVGNDTRLKAVRKNVFHDCTITGTWQAECACSTMFDDSMETMALLTSMTALSPVLRLKANRQYPIHAQGETLYAEAIEADGKEKPTLAFHTTSPNVDGLLIRGNNVVLRNLTVTDDYDMANDACYGANKQTSGNTISVKGQNNMVESLTIEGCDFRGGTSSSWVASSQTKNCLVENCTFTGYMADHGVYCSMKVESYQVKNCQLRDITHASGVFKVRTSRNLRRYDITNVVAHNMNSYLAMLALLETPEAEVTLDRIRVTKDAGNASVFYGFCFNDETKSLAGHGYNVGKITLSNCEFVKDMRMKRKITNSRFSQALG